jgi:multidrug efflux pump subunit AcrB/outer membrane protein TolC
MGAFMGNLAQWAFEQKRLILSISLIFILVGLVAMMTMAREEDPKLADRFGSLMVVYPGADPVSFERTVIESIEDELKTIEELKKIQTTIRPNFSVTEIELRDSVEDIEKVWNEVRSRLENIKVDFPDLVRYHLDRSLKVEGILLAVPVTDSLKSLDITRELKDLILTLPGIARVNIHGAPEEEIQVEVSGQKIADLGLGFGQVLETLKKSNLSIPGGLLAQKEQNILLTPNSRLENLEQIKNVSLSLGTGEVVKLGQIAEVRRGLKNPPQSLARLNKNDVYILGVAVSHPSDVVKVGARVREAIRNFENEKSIKIDEITFQPDRTESRLSELFVSLLTGVLSVAVLLSLWAGWRLGLVVALSVPAITLIGLAVYFMGGGVLHQISLAAFVLSLGQFIDNIIVVAEATQRRMNEGQSRLYAAQETIKEFARPMIYATGTGAAAFVPMLASTGSTAEFTFAIPLIAILTLVISYFFAILVVPVLASWMLRPRANSSEQRMQKLAEWIGNWVLLRPGQIVLFAFALLIICGAGFPFVKKQFFPEGDRNELIVRIEKPEGASFSSTNDIAKKLEQVINEDIAVKYAASFVGQGTPFFYYNLFGFLQNPALSEILVVTKDLTLNKEFSKRIEDWAAQNIQDSRVTVLPLEQGPPIKAPIEIRVIGKEFKDIEAAAHLILEELKLQPGLREAHISSGQKIVSKSVNLKDSVAAKYAINRDMLALTTLATTSGVEVTKYSGGRETVPLRVSFAPNQDLNQIPIAVAVSRSILVKEIADVSTAQIPGSIQRIGGERMMSIVGFLKPNTGYNEVMGPMEAFLEKQKFGQGVKIQIGGQAEGSEEANVAIFRAIPLGLTLLLVCLLLQFNSFSKITLIFLALPLAITGIVPGLLIGQAPFGFMSLLGLLALIGIVVNNAILLLETLEGLVKEGMSLENSIRKTLELRLQPILLTALLTVTGLLPLAFEGSTLWPPLAWTMISGLVASTFLTLAFLPAMYYLMQSKRKINTNAVAGLFVFFSIFSISPRSDAKSYNLQELWAESTKSFSVTAKKNEFESASFEEKTKRRQAYLPQVNAFAETKNIDRKLYAPSVFGPVEAGKQNQQQAGIEVTQSLFNYAQMGPGLNAVEAQTQAKYFETQRLALDTRIAVLKLALMILQLQEDQKYLKEFVSNLKNQRAEVSRFLAEGRASQADLTKVQIELSSAEAGLEKIQQSEADILQSLRIYIPDLEQIKAGPLPQLLESKIIDDGQNVNSKRSDLQALEKLIQAQDYSAKAVRAGHLPVLQAYGRSLYVDQGQLNDKNWFEFGIRLTMPLFEGGSRVSQVQTEVMKGHVYREQEQGLKRKIESELGEATRHWQQAERNLQRTENDLKIATQMVTEERQRFKKGRISLSTLLEAERLLLQQKRLSIEFKFGKIQSALEYSLAAEKDLVFE